MFNLAAALAVFVSAINALNINAPLSGSHQKAGTIVQFLISNNPGETAAFVDVVLSSANGRNQFVNNAPVGTFFPVNLNNDMVGFTSIVAAASAGVAQPAVSNIIIDRFNPVPYPPYPYPINPCYNPCWRDSCYLPRNPCNVPRIPCRIPRDNCYKPVCNVPRPRCRIRAVDASESAEAVELLQAESSEPEILGFAFFVSDAAESVEQFQQAEQAQAEQSQQAESQA